MIQLAVPQTPADFDAVRELCWEYRDYLLTFPSPEVDYVRKAYSDANYATVMAALETDYAPPKGGCILAMDVGCPQGCGMFHTIAPDTAEFKRIYVRDNARGTGLGRAITQALVDQCRKMGYSRILMDTSRRQIAAHGLYLSMGFAERGPYQDIPDEMISRMHFYEMTL